MRLIRKLIARAIRRVAKIHAFILDSLVYAIETGILLAKSFLKGCVLLLGTGGCLIFFLFLGPVGGWFARNPWMLLVFLIILIFPILGAISSSFLSYFKAVSTQYLMNLARYLEYPEQASYRPYRYYKQAYRRAQEDAARREQARRQQQQREWEERFRQWQQGSQWQQESQWQQRGSYGGGYATANPYVDFKNKYEKSCDVLGVPVTTDKNKIKLAYRRKAKQYHPDINKDEQATSQFQKINEAYEFLNDDNIERYQRMN